MSAAPIEAADLGARSPQRPSKLAIKFILQNEVVMNLEIGTIKKRQQ